MLSKLTVLVLITLSSLSGFSQSFFHEVNNIEVTLRSNQERKITPEKYKTFSCDLSELRNYFNQDLVQRTEQRAGTRLALPMPDGSMEWFTFKVNPTMQDGISARFPLINSFVGRGLDNPLLRAYIDYTYNGFHSVIYEGKNRYYIDPIATNQTENYIVYNFKDLKLSEERATQFTCGTENEQIDITPVDNEGTFEDETALEIRGNEIVTYRDYRLALATTGEYYQWHGGTPESVLSEVVTAINRVNSVLENDHAIHMTLIDETDQIFYSNGTTDPYTNGNTGEMINQNPTAISIYISEDKYDMGHVFGTNAGGLAQLQSVCGLSKARGVTCHSNPIGDGFYVDYVCHEMGHQFGGNHVMNSCNGNNENASTAYEPGSGSTIMSYSGLCGQNNVLTDSGPYYNVHTLSEFKNFTHNLNGNVCPIKTVTTNRSPSVTIPWEGGFYIPISTPFELTASGTDLDGDVLYYNWEQHDLGPASPLGSPIGNAPSFRSYDPDTSGTRIFPTAFKILTNQNSVSEVLPTYSRDLTFRFTARDFNPQGGGTDWTEVAFHATETAGPFLVSHPNSSGITWKVGDYEEVTWDVANTTNDLVNCQYVDMFLSHDNGKTFPDTIVTNVRNDGSHFVIVPNKITTKARIKIKGHGNKFFDISNAKFRIEASDEVHATVVALPDYQYNCLPDVASIDFLVGEINGFSGNVAFTVTDGLPTGATFSFNPTTAIPGQQVTLTIDLTDVELNGLNTIEVQATPDGGDPFYRYTDLDIRNSDYSTISNISPLNDAHNLPLTQNYSWSTALDAQTYDFQLAPNQYFYSSQLVYNESGLTQAEFQTLLLLEPNTIYYWRVRGVNECGHGEWRPMTAFKTEASVCLTYNKTQDIFIPSGAPNVKMSKINITENGTIQDVNVPIVRGNHSYISNLKMEVLSPAGTTVLLWGNECGSGSNFNLGFDDESQLALNCPLTGQTIHTPEGNLSDFDGETTQGEWTLIITDGNTSDGGTFKEWEIEFCQNIGGDQPQLINNNDLFIHPLDFLFIPQEKLEVTKAGNTPQQLEYTLITVPQNGTLSAFDYVLSPGQKFSQATINIWELKYTHTVADTESDSFRFEVRDEDGGWIGIYDFNIVIDAEAIYTDTKELSDIKELNIFPNPTNGLITVNIPEIIDNDIEFSIFDIQGKLIWSKVVENFDKTIQLNATNLANGSYVIKAKAKGFMASQKLILIK